MNPKGKPQQAEGRRRSVLSIKEHLAFPVLQARLAGTSTRRRPARVEDPRFGDETQPAAGLSEAEAKIDILEIEEKALVKAAGRFKRPASAKQAGRAQPAGAV